MELSEKDIQKYTMESNTLFPMDVSKLTENAGDDVIAKSLRILVMRDMHIALRAAVKLYGGTMLFSEHTETGAVSYVFSFGGEQTYTFRAGECVDAFLEQNLRALRKAAESKDGMEAVQKLKDAIQSQIVFFVFEGVGKIMRENREEKNPFSFN